MNRKEKNSLNNSGVASEGNANSTPTYYARLRDTLARNLATSTTTNVQTRKIAHQPSAYTAQVNRERREIGTLLANANTQFPASYVTPAIRR